MRLLVQRVKQASVTINEVICGSIKEGLLIFIGVHKNDQPNTTSWLAKKAVNLRIFRDENGKMNRNVQDIGGEILVISQFTLYGDCSVSRRPEFTQAALPEPACLLYEKFVTETALELGKKVETGIFGALMEVSLINDGPVTLIIEK